MFHFFYLFDYKRNDLYNIGVNSSRARKRLGMNLEFKYKILKPDMTTTLIVGSIIVFFALGFVIFLSLRCRSIINNIADNPHRSTRERLKDLK